MCIYIWVLIPYMSMAFSTLPPPKARQAKAKSVSSRAEPRLRSHSCCLLDPPDLLPP